VVFCSLNLHNTAFQCVSTPSTIAQQFLVVSLTEDPLVLATVVNSVNNFLADSAGLLQFLVIFLAEKLPHQYEVLTSEKTVTLIALHTTLMVKIAITLHTVLVDGLGTNLTTFLVVLVTISAQESSLGAAELCIKFLVAVRTFETFLVI